MIHSWKWHLNLGWPIFRDKNTVVPSWGNLDQSSSFINTTMNLLFNLISSLLVIKVCVFTRIKSTFLNNLLVLLRLVCGKSNNSNSFVNSCNDSNFQTVDTLGHGFFKYCEWSKIVGSTDDVYKGGLISESFSLWSFSKKCIKTLSSTFSHSVEMWFDTIFWGNNRSENLSEIKQPLSLLYSRIKGLKKEMLVVVLYIQQLSNSWKRSFLCDLSNLPGLKLYDVRRHWR